MIVSNSWGAPAPPWEALTELGVHGTPGGELQARPSLLGQKSGAPNCLDALVAVPPHWAGRAKDEEPSPPGGGFWSLLGNF